MKVTSSPFFVTVVSGEPAAEGTGGQGAAYRSGPCTYLSHHPVDAVDVDHRPEGGSLFRIWPGVFLARSDPDRWWRISTL